jgi:hypothetical protein
LRRGPLRYVGIHSGVHGSSREGIGLLKEQLEPELIVLRRGEPSIHQVIEPDEEPAGVRTQGGADDGASEPADKRAKDEWPDARAGGPMSGRELRLAGRTGIG